MMIKVGSAENQSCREGLAIGVWIIPLIGILHSGAGFIFVVFRVSPCQDVKH